MPRHQFLQLNDWSSTNKDLLMENRIRVDDIAAVPLVPLNVYENIFFEGVLSHSLGIKKVIFNDPATIVIWENGDKTVVKCQPGDTYDPEKGLALCIMKRALGNKGNYNNVFRKWLPEKGDKE